MKLQFKEQDFQLEAVSSVCDLFEGQKELTEITQREDLLAYHLNAPIRLGKETIQKRVQQTQINHHLPPSSSLSISQFDGRDSYNFSIEMETGTGKTYTYIRTIMELNKRYGWLKFVIVVPSVAIREGVWTSFEAMRDHFRLYYGKSPRSFVYDSNTITAVDNFATSADIEVMIINSQAFSTRTKRIYKAHESIRNQVPMEIIAKTRPILIIDEPQSVEGEQTKKNLRDFKPLFTLRYSATHKEKHDMLYRLDAMDAYNKHLVKKIAVKSIAQTTSTGTTGYLYLQAIIPQPTGAPKARIEFERRTKSGIKRVNKLISAPFDLYQASGGLSAYEGMTLQDFDARPFTNSIQVGASYRLAVGEVIGEIADLDMRRLQIRETIKTHLQKEAMLYQRGIKVLSLFFIDQVARYKQYDEQHHAHNGDYATLFEEEYHKQVSSYLREHKKEPDAYYRYLERYQDSSTVHAGYFSKKKVDKRPAKTILIDYKTESEEGKDSSDKEAYDLIMRDKARLLSFEEPVRFIFSHTALREGWDNPNVFQICTLNKSKSEIRKRQEIGRGMRLCVNQNGNRQDAELLGDKKVHDINKLTIIANESYDSFARGLQGELREELKDRAYQVSSSFLKRKILRNETGQELVIEEEFGRSNPLSAHTTRLSG
ncbi:DEAD/DEAH box helicase family protein [Streptococcus sciuri]|uniref:DEAD/DEAH box helicase family protein n=1 Tax=Streptococcus sciuri TaxID=2973939 RepID=A0ABT2F8E8_9STRE|nr:DEAD/DEAH box helicase family protein [Streptococcus sciuri]MCS4488112.1 DEAD/DEAH box helicase family protein [Streptococcus sciuri]